MISSFRSSGGVLALALVVSQAAAEDAAVIAYTNAALETAGKAGRIEHGTLVVRGGKIDVVGANVKVPDDARVIDATGKTLMPGILDPYHQVNLMPGAGEAAPRTVVVGRRGQQPVGRAGGGNTGFTRIADNFYPYDTGYRPLARSGLTTMNLVTPGYGQSAIIRVTPGQPETMMVNPDGFVYTAVSNDSTSLDIIRTALETAERVKKGAQVSLPSAPAATGPARAAPGGGVRGGGRRGGGRMGGGGFGGPAPTLTADLLKLWQDVHAGKTPLFAEVTSAAAIVHLLKAVEPYKDVRLVLVASGPALYEALDLLVGRPVRIVIRPGLSLKPSTRDRVALANVLHEAGLEFAFTENATPAESSAQQDSPLFPVAYLVRCGLPRQAAFEALTARPAAILGLDKTQGTLEAGKAANVLVFSGDPLDPGSQLTQVLIEGRTVYEN